jgi:TRAP-type uncharacterized transport system substrate-binding protein
MKRVVLAIILMSSLAFANCSFKVLIEENTSEEKIMSAIFPDKKECVEITNSSTSNFSSVLKGRALMGFVNRDFLKYIRTKDIDGKIDKSMAMVFPTTKKYLHIITHKDSMIKSFDDLAGKDVSVVSRTSSHKLSLLILSLEHGIEFEEITGISFNDSIQQLRYNRLDAIVFLSEPPVDMIKKNMNFLKIIPIDDISGDSSIYTSKNISDYYYSIKDKKLIPKINTLTVDSAIVINKSLYARLNAEDKTYIVDSLRENFVKKLSSPKSFCNSQLSNYDLIDSGILQEVCSGIDFSIFDKKDNKENKSIENSFGTFMKDLNSFGDKLQKDFDNIGKQLEGLGLSGDKSEDKKEK